MTRSINFKHNRTIPFTSDQVAEMARRYADGETLESLSGFFGVCRESIASRIRALGIEVRARGNRARRTADTIQQIRKLRDLGFSWAQVGSQLGYSHGHVQLIARKERANENALPV